MKIPTDQPRHCGALDRSAERQDATYISAIFGLTAVIFLVSPVYQLGDSHYSMLLSESLLRHGSFQLDRYFAQPLSLAKYPGYVEGQPLPAHIEVANGHAYYQFPPGSSVLSIPYVALMRLTGVSAANEDDTYNVPGEVRIERGQAALLMAFAACVFFLLGRQYLLRAWSAAIAIGGALATPVWSTASRVMWDHTWSLLLLSTLALVLVRCEAGRGVNPWLLGTLISWLFFVRPANALVVVVVTSYLLLYQRRVALRYILTGVAWAGLFACYSWIHFGSLLPMYIRHHAGYKLHLGRNVWSGLAGILVSPSRGLLIFLPSVIFVCWLLLVFRKHLSSRRLVWLAIACIVATVVMYASYIDWGGGHGFGARYMTDIVPWVVLLAILSVAAALRWQTERPGRSLRRYVVFGIVVTVLGVAVNAPGALSQSASRWNAEPDDVNDYPERLWDWHRPQFLAYLIPVPPSASVAAPVSLSPLATPLWRLDLQNPDAAPLLKGFSAVSDEGFRWSAARRVEVSIVLTTAERTLVQIKSTAFVPPGLLSRQRVQVSLNGQSLGTVELRGPRMRIYSVLVAPNRWRGTNQLAFDAPDADSPWHLGIGSDRRLLAMGIQTLEVYAIP